MSDASAVSPLLDAFALGEAVRDHHGIICTPAIHQVTEEKFMLKHISVPESQIQVDAMLLTGACENKEAAAGYYADMAQELIDEIEVFRRLARGRGFVPFFAHQAVPKSGDDVGTDLYVLSPWRTTLTEYARQTPLTHLAAVNLGLDLCACLVLARKIGYIYLNLKPENITVTTQRQFQVADFGLMKLDTLPYATFPDKYRSPYTAPELFDDLAEINTTADVYSLGMVLHSVFNCGNAPIPGPDGEERRRNGEVLPAPVAASEEMAQIIAKAIAPRPEDRWQSPEDMGTALIAYFQRNSVNDSPLAPIVPPEPEAPQEPEEPAEPDVPESVPAEEPQEPEPEAAESEPPAAEAEPEKEEDVPEEEAEPSDLPEEVPEEVAEPAVEEDAEEEPAPLPEPEATPQEEPEPEAPPAPELPPVAPEEMNDILDRADAFLGRTKADPTVPPDTLPEFTDADPEDAEEEEDTEKGRRPFRNLFISLTALLIAAGLILGALVFYFEYYRVNVDSLVILESALDSLTVSVSTRSQELYLTCQDTYGNAFRADAQNSPVVFTGLNPGTQYTVTAMVDGFHTITGPSKVSATTLTQTEIVDFGSMIGAEDGSLVLYFTVSGAEPTEWVVRYSTPGEDERTHSFTGHTVSIAGLTVGKDYTFTLEASDSILLTGEHTLTAPAEAVILAQNLRVTEYGEDSVTLVWDQPEVPVESWTARCYSGEDFSEAVTVTDCTATISGVDLSKPCTVDVTAAGMTQNTWIAMTSYPACLSGCSVGLDTPGEMSVSWAYTGTAPGQWVFQYSYGDEDAAIDPTVTDEAAAVVSPMLPNTRYIFTITSATGSTVFNNVFAAALPEASVFTSYGVGSMTMTTYPTPLEPAPTEEEEEEVEEPEETVEEEPWTWGTKDLLPENMQDTFSAEDTMVFLLTAENVPNASDKEISTLILIRNADGVPVNYLTGSAVWDDMWNGNLYACELTQLPQESGTYSLEYYLNGQMAAQCEFTIQ